MERKKCSVMIVSTSIMERGSITFQDSLSTFAQSLEALRQCKVALAFSLELAKHAEGMAEILRDLEKKLSAGVT